MRDMATEMSTRAGYVYVMTNAYMPGLAKIGSSRKHPEYRAAQLASATSVPDDFTIAYYLDYHDAFVAEAAIHRHFEGQRVNKSREFFRLSVSDAVAFLKSIANSSDDLSSQGITGGEWGRLSEADAYPFARLFASFEDRGDGVLNETERARCRALEGRTL